MRPYLPGRKALYRHYGGLAGSALGHDVTVINPVEKLLAVGHYLQSTVDIAESTRRIPPARSADHMVLMAGFTAGNEKVSWWCWGVTVLTSQQQCWPACLRRLLRDLDRR